jgi:hypothetical protein
MRDEHWEEATGGTLEVGARNTITFTGPGAVEEFLPAGGKPRQLSASYTDPASTESGGFGGQVVALKLNVLYSDAGIGLKGAGAGRLGELYIADGAFKGLTVREFLALAERELGGEDAGAQYGASVSDFSDAADRINNNFVDCKGDKGRLERGDCG